MRRQGKRPRSSGLFIRRFWVRIPGGRTTLKFGTHVRIDGDPKMSMQLVTSTELDATRTPSLHAAMGVVNSIPTVCTTPPGFRTALDLPIWAGASVR